MELLTDSVVVAVEQHRIRLWRKPLHPRGPEHESLEEPRGMCAVPLGRARVGHALDGLVFGRKRRSERFGLCAHANEVELVNDKVKQLPITSVFAHERIRALAAEISSGWSDWSQALHHARLGKVESETSGRRPTQVLCLLLEMEATMNSRRPQDAIAIGEEALLLAQVIEDVHLSRRCRRLRGQAWQMLGRPRVASSEYLAAEAMEEAIAGNIRDGERRDYFLRWIRGVWS